MDKKADSKATAAPFIIKTYSLLENPAYQAIVSWTPLGESFAIHNTDEMANRVLPAYFKSQNLCSFIRQLNTYGFNKVDSQHRLEFKHDLFVRGRTENLGLITRRKSVKRETEDQTTEERKVPAPTPVSPSGSEVDSHRSPPFPETAVPSHPSPTPIVAEMPTALIAAQNNQIAQIGSILQKILVELERVKRDQSSLRDAVSAIQQQQQQQQQQAPPVHRQQHMTQSYAPANPVSSLAPMPPPALLMEKVRSEPELLDVIGDMHRTTLEPEINFDFDEPIPIDELLGEVLQLPQGPAANGHT